MAQTSRRDFLRQTAVTVGAVAFPYIVPSSALGKAGAVSTTLSRTGVYGILRDDLPPEISNLEPTGSVVLGEGKIDFSASVLDYGMGIDWNGVTFRIDGAAVTAEYDPDRNRAYIPGGFPLKKGKHDFVVEAVDRAGNRPAPARAAFTVK